MYLAHFIIAVDAKEKYLGLAVLSNLKKIFLCTADFVKEIILNLLNQINVIMFLICW